MSYLDEPVAADWLADVELVTLVIIWEIKLSLPKPLHGLVNSKIVQDVYSVPVIY